MTACSLVDRIDRLLPQTQCEQCGFPGCRPYAEALARAEVDIDRCPPGGDSGAHALASLLGREPRPVDRSRGETKLPQIVWIDESVCIGCTKCIQACPVDAIIGASKRMHTIIEAECTGCELCIAPCPVDCIHIRPIINARHSASEVGPERGRNRFAARLARHTRDEAERDLRLKARLQTETTSASADPIAAALARARARRGTPGGSS
jgi:electron transport complex protein RnfB